MALHLKDKWVWDFWLVREGSFYHIFYLQAPRSLGNPDIRHWHSSIGHALSADLIQWEVLPDVLGPSENEKAWDSYTTWTGCTLQHKKTWYLFYTGTSRSEKGLIQRIGLATSENLISWSKYAGNPVLDLDPQWYEVYDKNIWYEETWRDPWIFELDGKFFALITARAKTDGEPKERGVVGLAFSDDLFHWEVKAPLTKPGEFAYLEVPQIIRIRKKYYLIFSVDKGRYSNRRMARKNKKALTGTHYMIADSLFGPYRQPENDILYADEQGSTYSGKLIQDNSGDWKLITAIQYDSSNQFIGDISDPLPIIIKGDGEILVQETNSRSYPGNITNKGS